MDRADSTGLGIAIAGHVLVFGALSLAFIAVHKPPLPPTPPVDIQIVDEVSLKDQVPNPSPTPPAPSVAPEVGPQVEDAPPPEPVAVPKPAPPAPAPARVPAPAPVPVPKAVAKPKPTPAAKPLAPKPAVAKAQPARPTLKLALATPEPSPAPKARPHGARLGSDFLKGIADHPSPNAAQTPRGPIGPAVEASLQREVLRQLKPHWQSAAPTGADVEQLRTTVSIRLNRDGSVAEVRVKGTTGVTDSNRAQVRLHQEAAVKAVRLAAPFVLPANLYDAWQFLEPVFDKRLG